MATIPVYSPQGTLERNVEGDPSLFDTPLDQGVVHHVIVGLASGRRRHLARTKTRGMVRGGGRKPWKQKGTGRARQGSIRSPQWRGGGVVFGPDGSVAYTKAVNKAAKNKAFRIALSERVREGQCAIISSLPLQEGKTKALATVVENLHATTPLHVERGILWVRSAKADGPLARMARNIPKTWVSEAQNVGVEDVVKYPVLLFTSEGFEEFTASRLRSNERKE